MSLCSIHRVHLCAIFSNSASGHFVILCHFLVIFTARVPFSLQSNPFTLPSNSLGHPRVLSLFFSSDYLLLCSSFGLVFTLPPALFCSPAAHKNSSFLSPENYSVSLRFTAFFYARSPTCSPYLSPLVSLRFGSTTQRFIKPIFSFVPLTHACPSLSPSVLSFSIPPCHYKNRY